MAKAKPRRESDDGVKDDRRIQLKPYTFGRLTKMAEQEDATPTELGNIAVKEYLKKHGYWDEASTDRDAAEAE